MAASAGTASWPPAARKCILDDAEFGEEPCLYCGNAAPVQRTAGGHVADPSYLCEAAGAAFAARHDLLPSEGDSGRDDEDGSSDVEQGEHHGRAKGNKFKDLNGEVLKLSDALKDVNLYTDILCCAESCTQDELKKAYRSLCLTAHPDKVAATDEKEAKKAAERFVLIQEAFEILSDPAKRIQYDSALPFDDSVPKFKPDSGEDFYEVFGEAFKRNARFSVRRPVPDLGGPDAKSEDTKRFYNFWFEFQSWRDPLALANADGEELADLGDAECREEKRWMMRENARVAKKYKQAEKDRISELVRLAEKFDPRILAEKAAKRDARNAEMARRAEEKLAAQRVKEEAERKIRIAEEVRLARENQVKKEEKAAREAVKAELKKCRQRVRAFQAEVEDTVMLDQVNEVCLQLPEEDLRKLGDALEKALKKNSQAGAEVFYKAIEKIGLKPMREKPEEDTATTASSANEAVVELTAEERKRLEEAALKRRKEAEQRQKEEAAERAIRDAERAEERKRADEEKKKEQQKADAKSRQQEKKEAEKIKKEEEKKIRDAAKDVERREQQREEAKERSKLQAEKDKQEALNRQAEQDVERVTRIFEADRSERMDILEKMTNEELTAGLASDDVLTTPVRAVLVRVRQAQDGQGLEVALDRALALLYGVSPVWHLGLPPPAEFQLPSHTRARVKKARSRLRGLMSTFLTSVQGDDSALAEATEWQRGIADGTAALPVWTLAEREAELAARAAAAAESGADAGKKPKKAKAAKEPKGDENLDDLLAEFGVTPSAGKKKGNKKK